MWARIRCHLTYANVMATIAVSVALGGSAYAAIKLPADSVGTRQLKSHAVTPSKVARSTIAQFKGDKGDKGDPGPQGLQGPKGDKGDAGGKSLAVRAANGTGRVTASCGPGEFATGGGAHSFGGSVTASAPAAEPNAIYTTGGISYQGYAPASWTAAAKKPDGSDADVTAWVVCVAP